MNERHDTEKVIASEKKTGNVTPVGNKGYHYQPQSNTSVGSRDSGSDNVEPRHFFGKSAS
jgi:hypothetical protein